MKNNKGYYSWIHQLNRAGLEAQQNGFRMINEAKAAKITDPAQRAKLMGQMPVAKTVNPEAPSAHPADVVDTIARLGKTSASTIALADGDVGEYKKIKNMKQAEKLAQMAQQKGPIDAKPTGDAQDVEDDAQDGVMADPDTRLPSYAIAAQARAETKAIDDADAEMDMEENEDARRWSDYTGRTGEVHESLSQKISRILKG
jgi:hypothetical protein